MNLPSDDELKEHEEAFQSWFDAWFCNQQGEDSPYGYNDVHAAFVAGILSGMNRKL